jgi:hypothetical protein
MLLIVSAILAILGVGALFVVAWWGIPILAAAGLLMLIQVAAARKRKGSLVGTVERSRRPEPTGAPRKASGGAETANERVGQA